MTNSCRIWRIAAFFSLLLCLAAGAATPGWALELDFGLPLFSHDEIRLEKEKAPNFNMSLFQKYLNENQETPLNRFHAIVSFARLIVMSEDGKSAELRKQVLDFLKPPAHDGKGKQLLDYLFAQGLLLAQDRAPDPDNKKDHEFEDLLLKAEDQLQDIPEYALIKGIVFQALRSRPNQYFAPMKPFNDLKNAMLAGKNDPHFFFVLGQAFRLLGREEQHLFHAVVCYEKAAALDVANQKLQSVLLGVYMGLHESYQGNRKTEPFWLEEAVYKKILTMSPNNPYALNNLSFLYAEYGVHRREAQEMAQRAVDQIPSNPGFRDTLGWAAFKNQDYEKAEVELKKAAALNPESYDAAYHLGTLYYVRKNYEKAIEQYERAVTIKPDAAETLNNYAYLLAENDRDLEKAHGMAKKAVAFEPENPSYIDTLGWLEFKLGNLDEAGRYLRKAFQLAPDVGEILAHLGKYYIHVRQFDTGLNYLKQALKQDRSLEFIQDDIFFAMNLAAHHQTLMDYHRAFQDKVRTKHINSTLVQISRLYQDEGMFSQATAINQICESLRAGKLDLEKPIFDFYTLEVATPTVILASPTVESTLEIPIAALPEKPLFASGTMEAIAKVPVALNVGPAIFGKIARRVLAFDGFENLSASLFIRDLLHPYHSAVLVVEFPGGAKRDLLKAIGETARFYGSRLEGLSREKKAGVTQLSKSTAIPFWIEQVEDFVVFGLREYPGQAVINSFLATFPARRDVAFGLLLDWNAAVPFVPEFFKAFIGNPLGAYKRVYSRYLHEPGLFKETTILEPTGKKDKVLIHQLATDLMVYRLFFQRFQCPTEMRVQPFDENIRVDVEYRGLRAAFERFRDRLGLFSFFLVPRFQNLICTARRVLFDGNMANFPHLCPQGGNIRLHGESGAMSCPVHRDLKFVFPLLGESTSRCSFARGRLESLLQIFNIKEMTDEQIQGLLKEMIIDYNVPACAQGGTFSVHQGQVECSIHSTDNAKESE